MYKNYKNIKKSSKINKVIKPPSLVALLLIVLICMSIGYSYWSTSLTIEGRVTAKALELPIKVYARDTEEENEKIRYSNNTGFSIDGTEVYQIIEERYEGGKVITTIKKVNDTAENIKASISLPIHNTTTNDFYNGKIRLIDKKDTNGILNNINYSLSSGMIVSGGKNNINISGELKGNANVPTNTFYNFEITFDIKGEKHYFYYNLIIVS